MQFFDIIPIAGIILSNIFGINLIYTFNQNKEEYPVKEYNKLLFPILFINNINWFLFGILYEDLYITLSCLIGTFGTFLTTMLFYKYSDIYTMRLIEIILNIFMLYVILIIYLKIFFVVYNDIILEIISTTTIITHVITYTIPFYTIKKIIDSGNTESIYTPFTFIGFINSFLWTIYGFNQNSMYQIIPNGYGILSSFIQIGITIWYIINK